MTIIALEKELKNVKTLAFRKNAKAEAKALWRLYLSGIVREFHFRKEKNLAVLILEAKNKNLYLSFFPFYKNKQLERIELSSYGWQP